VSAYRIISAENAEHAVPVSLSCELLEVSRSGYYEWATRGPCERDLQDLLLIEKIREIHKANRGVYGAPRIHAELRMEHGIHVGRKRVERLMRQAGVCGLVTRKRARTTVSVPGVRVADDLVDRNFRPEAPNVLWVADITYLRTWEGWLYLAAVQDAFSRLIVGWSMADNMEAPLVVDALKMALARRRPPEGLIHHSDQGSQPRLNRSSQHTSLTGGVAMGARRRRSDRAGRPAMYSPGRPSVGRREERQRFWAAIARGVSTVDAAGEAGVSEAVGVRWFREGGGMPTVTQAPLSGRYLSLAEREEIALLRARGCGVREIARSLGRSPSTISRELRRNAATRSGGFEYRATTAQWHADRRAQRPKVAKLVANDQLRGYVQDRLAGEVERPDGSAVTGPQVRWIGRRHGRRTDRRWARSWSPEQIAHRLPVDFPDDASMRISHEAIYQALYVQARGALRRELTACLRTGRALRVPRARSRARGKGFVTEEILISERPAEAEDRAVPGHWEGDLILGLGSSAIGTLVERSTRFTMLLHLPPMPRREAGRVKNGPALAGHGAEAVRDGIAAAITTLPEQLRRSLTWDQGAEMSQHVQLRMATGLAVYFCDPHSPWQRGTNENTNGLLRQYFPKGTDLARHTPEDLAAVATTLNSRPRKTLGWKTPAEALNEYLQSYH